MNNLEEFTEFYLKVVLPNATSYKSFFNESNIDKNFIELIDKFQESYDLNPFEISTSFKVKELISQKKEPFYGYSQKKGSDIPQSILNKHYSLFLDYNKVFQFNNLQEVIGKLHELFGKSFIRKFQEERINLNGNSKIASSSEIFGTVRKDYWTINKGSECELQYHIYKDGDEIGYGFGFNAQKSMNNLNPIENVSPFINSFFINKNKIDVLLKDYSFGHQTIQDLKNINEGDFVFFGKIIEIKANKNIFEIEGLSVLEMLYDLKNKQFECYKLIFENSKNITIDKSQIFNMIDKENLLKYKKQIILQGPPGTGKTRLAKEIAKKLLNIKDSISDETIIKYISVNQHITSSGGKKSYVVVEVDVIGKRIKLRRETDTEDFTSFSTIISAYETKLWQTKLEQNAPRRAASIAKFIFDKINNDETAEQLKLIQFHPSYTYEDFVRGIVAESKGEKVEYRNVNKTLGLFAKEALANFKASSNDSPEANLEAWIDEKFGLFKNEIEAKMPEEETILSGDISIFNVTDSHFKYAEKWKTPGYLNFTEFKKLVKAVLQNELELSNKQLDKEKFTHAHYRYTYYNSLLKLFFDNYSYERETVNVEAKNYVLIIDEINRANLSSVLGELIYALEYRGEEVESMYEVDGSQKLILPPNLYIIGTMNTADRSVGHIDYAIRRRFAFVDVLPEELEDDNDIYFNKTDFLRISSLFNDKNVSNEFEIEAVQIGHSYFIVKKTDAKDELQRDELFKMKMDYEVKPILLEYERDGILIGEFDGKPIRDYLKSL